jgi:sugar O-acyltransferase (sialic acid O-acetyltransferase NeuD family)
MNQAGILIFGVSGYAKLVADALLESGAFPIAGFVDRVAAPGMRFLGDFPVFAEADVLAGTAAEEARQAVVAIGDNAVREKVVGRIAATRPDLAFPVIRHPSALVSRFADVGAGTVLLPHAILNAAAKVGAQCSIYTNAVVEHDCVLADYVTLAPSVALGGNVHIGARSFLGLGATANHGCRIGDDTIVGAGGVVVTDLPDLSIAVGAPARVIRSRSRGSTYL